MMAPTTSRLSSSQFALLALAVGCALLPHLQRLPTWLGVALIVIVLARVVLRRRGMGAAARWIRLPLTIALVALTWREYGNVFGRDAGAALATGLLALKLLETEKKRDARVGLGFAAFVLMSALLFDQGLTATALVSAALIVVIAALAALQPAALPAKHPQWRMFRLAMILFACGIPIALAGFVLIPRLASPLWGTPADQRPRIGLNDDMKPGSMTDLLIDETPALRAVFDAPIDKPDQQFFRAIVLWDFDGETWTGKGVLKPESVEPVSAPTNYTITMEATERRWLPTLDVPLAAPDGTRMSSERVVLTKERLTQPRAFKLQSALRYRLGLELGSGERQRALALPNQRNPKTLALAAEWKALFADKPDAIVSAALDLYYSRFTYTLAPPLLGRDSVDEFLFSTQAGYCEHYSSSFVVLMRAAGIPARVVTGYQGGWWSSGGNYLLIRHSDAHAWAEVWFDGRGWERVDPTAAVNPIRVIANSRSGGELGWLHEPWIRDLRNRMDGINRLWTEAVVQFNALRQKQALTRFGISDASQRDLVTVLTIIVIAMLTLATLWALRKPALRRTDALERAWLALCGRIAISGPQRRDNEGPRDYAARVASHYGANGAEIVTLIQRYIALRYAGGSADPNAIACFARSVRNHRWPTIPR
ncbi:MAG: DUF3488 and transglutaminase-like domain-containing protein [Dokdonella sp.]